ncbi:MAG: hypothetical protein ACLPPF_00545 [Rhodomicrobium sp.]
MRQTPFWTSTEVFDGNRKGRWRDGFPRRVEREWANHLAVCREREEGYYCAFDQTDCAKIVWSAADYITRSWWRLRALAAIVAYGKTNRWRHEISQCQCVSEWWTPEQTRVDRYLFGYQHPDWQAPEFGRS